MMKLIVKVLCHLAVLPLCFAGMIAVGYHTYDIWCDELVSMIEEG